MLPYIPEEIQDKIDFTFQKIIKKEGAVFSEEEEKMFLELKESFEQHIRDKSL